MAVTGLGTELDPWVVQSWDDFCDACDKYTNLGNDGMNKSFYIEFPPGGGVVDLRKSGWVDRTARIYTSQFRQSNNLAYPYQNLKINGNGWVILGLSIQDIPAIEIVRNFKDWQYYSGNTKVEIINLHFKNFYALAGKDPFNFINMTLREHSSPPQYYPYQAIVHFTECSFSGVMDSSSNYTTRICSFYNSGNVEPSNSKGPYANEVSNVYFNSCSFNIKFVHSRLFNADYNNELENDKHATYFRNCLINVTGTPNNEKTGQNYDADNNKFMDGIFQFCKITGDLIINRCETRTTPSYAYYRNPGITFRSQSFYNTVSLNLKITAHNVYYTPKLCFRTWSGTHIVNKDIEDDTVKVAEDAQRSQVYFLDEDQMVNKDYLNDLEFVVGDIPETT